MASTHDQFPITYGFEREALKICDHAEKRGEPVYGISPWYCAADVIEHGVKVAFIGANPGGGARSQQDDKRTGRLLRPYKDERYNAWLDDRHWEGRGAVHQERVVATFKILFGNVNGVDVLRSAACLNVVPVRSSRTSDLSARTWRESIEWATRVLKHIAPEIIVCNGNGEQRSAWSALDRFGTGITRPAQRPVNGNYSVKRRTADGVTVIGLPHLSWVSPEEFRTALKGWTFSGS